MFLSRKLAKGGWGKTFANQVFCEALKAWSLLRSAGASEPKRGWRELGPRGYILGGREKKGYPNNRPLYIEEVNKKGVKKGTFYEGWGWRSPTKTWDALMNEAVCLNCGHRCYEVTPHDGKGKR